LWPISLGEQKIVVTLGTQATVSPVLLGSIRKSPWGQDVFRKFDVRRLAFLLLLHQRLLQGVVKLDALGSQ
jgi:hypothetical protein